MAYSTETVVSDGTLTSYDITIEFIDRADIHVFFDDVEDAYGWIWVGDSGGTIDFSTTIPNGVVVRIQRRTQLDEALHVFGEREQGGSAQFTDRSVDENFDQFIKIAQEAREEADTNTEFLENRMQAVEAEAAAATAASNLATSTANTALSQSNAALAQSAQAAADAAQAVQDVQGATEAAQDATEAANAANAAAAAAQQAAEDAAEAIDPRPDFANATDPTKGAAMVGYRGETVADRLSRTGVSFDSVADMAASPHLKVGDYVQTSGYYSHGDGGGNAYIIVAAGTGTPDGGRYIDLPGSGLQAEGQFSDTINVLTFGARNTNTGDVAPAFNAAFKYGFSTGRAYHIYAPAGRYRVASEIDWRDCEGRDYSFRGERHATTFNPTSFGSSKAIFRPPSNTRGTLENISVDPFSRSRTHPIGILAENISQTHLIGVRFSGLGNTAIWTSRPFNCDWRDLDLFFNGFQPIHKSINTSVAKLSWSANSNVLTCNEAVFDAGDVGKQIYVQGPAGSNHFTTFITAVNSSTSITVAFSHPSTGSNRRFSFTAIKGSIAQGSNLVTSETALFEPSDLGRFVYIPRAGVNGIHLTAKIIEVVDSMNARLDVSALNAATQQPIFFTPTLYMGEYGASGTPINDIVISNMLIEGFEGPGLITERGTHLYLNNLKTHSKTVSDNGFNDFGKTGTHIMWGQTNRGVINGYEQEFGVSNIGDGGGVIDVSGSTPALELTNVTVSGPYIAPAYINFRPTTAAGSALVLGTFNGPNAYWANFGTFVRTDTYDQRLRVLGNGPTIGRTQADELNAQVPMLMGSFRSIEPQSISSGGGVLRIKPMARTGFLMIASETTALCTGVVWYRMPEGQPQGMQVITGMSGLTTTKDTADSLNVYNEGGYIVLQNTRTSFIRVTVTILG